MARKRQNSKKSTRKDKDIKTRDALNVNEIQDDYSNKKKNNKSSGELKNEGRNNDPNWYYLDARIAEQVSQLSFQQLAGYDVLLDGTHYPVPNVVTIYINPSPGVQLSVNPASQQSAINVTAFRLFTKLAAFTGRSAVYGPQDIATMILAMGEVISCVEWVRRAFGVAYQMNMRNRAYPKKVLQCMQIDADDMFEHLADYRTKFNTIITMVNQLPIPFNIAYFDKCAKLYEKIYLDSPSDMAQTIFYSPFTTWILDESGYAGGSVLRTQSWMSDRDGNLLMNQTMSTLLTNLNLMVNTLLQSSTLQVVYTDLLNLATKLSVPFWHLDYLFEDYIVMPEYNMNFLLQFHNQTTAGVPWILNDESLLASGNTPYNDVYPNAATNTIVYNPVFSNALYNSVGLSACPKGAVIDMLTDQPSTEDRIEVTRFISSAGDTAHVINSRHGKSDFALPDHYVVHDMLWPTSGSPYETAYTNMTETFYGAAVSSWSQIDWAPRHYIISPDTSSYLGVDIGDLNFYTTVDREYLRRLHDFVGLGLYDMR